MGLKPLGIVKEIAESVGMGISYVFEDLIFLEHNGFILEFTDTDNEVIIHVNETAVRSDLEDAILRMKNEASTREMIFTEGEPYRISQADEENIRLEFIRDE